MSKYQGIIARIILMGTMIMGLVFNPQYSVFAAPILTVTPITWNVIGLDSNNVNVGPNDFPVGARVCNTGDTPATNVVANFVWDSANPYINLRPGSLNPITLASLPNGQCFDFYFEVVITRTTAAYDTTRQYHINATADALGTVSTPTPRDIYVEHLVSQNRNSVLDVQLNGVSVAAGGTMNLVVGNTYTITLFADTATNGYDQIETFINSPNTIFQIESVSTTYTADGGTDPNAGTKLYADGCGWDNATRSCTGTGKYGGQVTVTYTFTLAVTAKVNSSGSYANMAEIVASDLIDPNSTPNNHNPNEDDQATVTVSPRTPIPSPKPTPAPSPSISVNGFLIPVTGFAPNVVTDMSRVPYATYTDTTISLEIPSLSVNIPIVGVPKADGTWNVSWLENQAGWLEGSAFPTWNGNSVLAGHVYLSNGKPGPFAKLYELQFADQIIIHAYGQTSVYEVLSNAIVAPTDRSVMKHEETPWLTLVTCTDYNPKTGTYDNRFIVRAVLIKVSTDK